MNFQTHTEILADCFIKLGEAIRTLSEALSGCWDELKEIISRIDSHDHITLNDNPSWHTPMKLILKSQVVNRKPLLARARSSC